MSFEFPLLADGTHIASSDYNDALDQFCIVKQTTAATPTVVKTTAVSDASYGVLADRPSSGFAANVIVQGIAKVRVLSTAHTAIVPGTKITGGASGGAMPSTAVGSYVLGRSRNILAANTTGIISILITHQGGGSSGAGGAA